MRELRIGTARSHFGRDSVQHLKQRLRLLAEFLGGTLEPTDAHLTVRFETASARFTKVSHQTLRCDVTLASGDAFPVRASHAFIFDLAHRAASPHWIEHLHEYEPLHLLILQEFIDEEQGGTQVDELREQIANGSAPERVELGGNRILATFYKGCLILQDDLGDAATNVVTLEGS